MDEVSAELRISTAYLSALEFNDLSAIPNATFARGYLKTYSRFLGIMEPESAMPQQAAPAQEQRSKLTMARPLKRQTRATDPMVKGVSAVIVVVTLVATLYWWRSQQNNEVVELPIVTNEVVAVDTAAGTLIVSTEAATSSLGPNLVELENTLPEDGSVEPVFAAEGTSEVVPEMASQSAPQADPPSVAMIAEFSDTSWVEVRNAANEVLFTGVKKAGDTLQLEGEALLNVVVGNAAGVELSYNGSKVQLAEFTDERNVAKLKLGL